MKSPVRFDPPPTLEDYREHIRILHDILEAQGVEDDERHLFALRYEVKRFAHWIAISSEDFNDGPREMLLEMAASPTGRLMTTQRPTVKDNVSVVVHNPSVLESAECLVAGGLAAWVNEGKDEIRITALGRLEATKINDLIRSFSDSSCRHHPI